MLLFPCDFRFLWCEGVCLFESVEEIMGLCVVYSASFKV
jgi:hypothetical protein